MRDRKIPKTEWQSFFDGVSKTSLGKRIELEVVGLDLGDQIEDEWVSLVGFSYDPRSDAFYVHTTSIAHQIARPREIDVIEEGGALLVVCVRDAEGRSQICKLKAPLMLEAPIDF